MTAKTKMMSNAMRKVPSNYRVRATKALASVKEQKAKIETGPRTKASSDNRSETKWRGASRALRSMASWLPQMLSAQRGLPATERVTLIARSQDAYRNHMVARAAVARNRTNVVGTGLIMHPSVDAKALGITEEQAQELNELIARRWKLWSENPTECDIEATSDIYGLQAIALVSSMLAGDAFAITPYAEQPGGIYGLKVQLIDGARVSNPNCEPNSIGAVGTAGTTLVDGVKLDRVGKPISYYVRRKHPSDVTLDDGWDEVAVFGSLTGRRRAMHIWNDKDQIGAVRGAPYLAPILEPLQTLETYGRAELMAAVISAMFTVFLEKDSQSYDDTGGAFDGQTTEGADGSQNIALGNAAIVDLAPGEKANIANPARPNVNFDPFFVSVVKQIGAALEIPLDELLLQYNASYSAARAAMLQAWRFYTMRRWTLVQQFCQPIYQLWFDEDVSRGGIPVTGYSDPERRAAYTSAIWVGPARGSMDELKEAKAARERIDAGISNETIETAAMTGEDWTSVYGQRKREIDRRKRDGTYNEKAPANASTTPQSAEPDPNEEDNQGNPAQRGS